MISCKDYVKIKKEELKERVNLCPRPPHLVVFQVDSDQASNSYINGKRKDCEEVGIKFTHVKIESENYTQAELCKYIGKYSCDPCVDGIIVQLPIPDKYDKGILMQYIDPLKDVDGFRRDSAFKPCTPKGIMDWFKYNNVKLEGSDVCVIGRSDIVGKPLVNMLIDEGATVTCCNSKTQNIELFTNRSEIVISAVGKPKIFDSSYFRFADIIVDVGINRDEDGKLCGDIDTTGFDKFLSTPYVTPVPGGVGLLTRVVLLENVVSSCEKWRTV